MSRSLLSKKEYGRLKGNLTRARNTGDPVKVVATCRDAFDVFEHFGHPDDWHRWLRAEQDAIEELRRDAYSR